MTLQDLRYVVTLAELKHFARAAEACYVSQPTLSTQIKKLEAELGVALFERTNKRVMPTPAGAELIAQARVVLQEAEKLRDMAQQAHDPMSGPIQLGVIPTLGPYLLPHLVPQLRADYPNLRLYLREDLTATLVERLRTGMLDAILVALPIQSDGLEIIELFREPFMMALPMGDPLTQKTEVVETDLADTSLLLLEDGHCLRDQALAVCGFPPRGGEDFRASSLETLRQMVAAGVGCTLLPILAIHAAPLSEPLIELRPFANPEPSRTIGLALRRGFPRMEMVQAFAAFIRRYAPDGVTVIPSPNQGKT
ncbi:LysR substrate-binding domain-containing protein [Candidatus Entotheonella palauensis]|uniref:LysR substrate-binding domain-containing protein n=1 Tax=Candidatus Entotheonella palauensis TaxID=93172 RepID=UPI0015C472C2|nr:LysR substrate-binding domain-containing protein [Candidatus Entotheonella palauensis]